MTTPNITQSQLKELLHYDPDTGIFTWLWTPRRGWVGKRAGSFRPDLYRAIKIGKYSYLEHRLAWFYTHGEWPDLLDHINRNEAANRIENLRSTNQHVNQLNRKNNMFNGNPVGVFYCERDARWAASMTFKGVAKTQYFGTRSEAIAARNALEDKHGYRST